MRSYLEMEMPEELKQYKENEFKDTYLRSQVEKFHLPRLKHQDDYVGILFNKVFDNYKTGIAHRNKRVGKKM